MRLVPTIIGAIIFIITGAMVVSQRLQLTELGYEIGKHEREIRSLEEAERTMQMEISRQINRQEIARLVRDYNLPLVAPGESNARSKGGKG